MTIMTTRTCLITLASFLLFLALGCSSGNPLEPRIIVTPDGQDNSLPLFISEGSVDGRSIGRGLLGAFDLVLDPAVPSAELVPLRSANREGDSFLVNITPYFTVTPCKDCLSVGGVTINSDNQLVVTFKATHPFPPANIAFPPSAKNRDDLRLFDVKLVAILEGETKFTRLGITLKPGVIANAEGYTHIEDPIIDFSNDLDTNAFPYIILGEDSSNGNVDPLAPTGFTDLATATGHNVFNQGGTYYGDMTFDLKYGGLADVKLLMFGSYGQSAENLSDRFTPQYWLPEFNIKEPWKIETEITANTLNDAMASSSATLEVKIWDWQHSTTKIDPYLTDLDAILGSSKIDHIEVEISGVTQQNIVVQNAASGTGLGTDPLIYQMTINNEKLAAGGKYWGLVKALDTREQGLNYGDMGELVDFEPGVGNTFIKVYEFATYQVFPVEIEAVGGPACGPMHVKLQHGATGDLLMKDIVGTELHLIDGADWKIKAIASSPNAAITSIDFDFDDPGFEDQIGGATTLQRVYTNPSCAAHDPFVLHLTITVKDDCDATIDWVEILTIYIHCGTSCGPVLAGTVTYSVNGGDYQPLPTAGITIPSSSELTIRADGFSVTNGDIEFYTWDFDDPTIEDQSWASSGITRTLTHPNCNLGGAEPYELGLQLTITDDCPLTNDYIRNYTITIECPATCGPIASGIIQYSLDDAPFTPLPGNSIVITDDRKLAFQMFNFSSPNAAVTTYTFDFDDPDYTDQTGSSDTITTIYDNPNCVAGFGDSEFVTLTYRIADDCIYSADYVGQIVVQIICSSCNGTGLSFSQNQRTVASSAVISGLDITKMNGGGMKLSDGGGGNLYAGYMGTRVSDSAVGLGFARSSNNGDSWNISRFLPTTPDTPAGFSIATADGLTIVVAWFEQSQNKIYIERSINGGIAFNRSEIYDAVHGIRSISLAQDPNNPAIIYLVFVENNDEHGNVNSLKLLKSNNTGDTFPLPGLITIFSSDDAYDRVFNVADIAVSPLNSNVYVAAVQSDEEGSNILVARSNNYGANFNAGAKVLSNEYNQTIESCDIAITTAAQGGQAVYIAYAQGTEQAGAVKLIKGAITSGSFTLYNSLINDNDEKRPLEASVAVDKLGGVYVTWHESRTTEGQPDIYADYSANAGFTFGTDVQASEGAAGSGVNRSANIVNNEGPGCEIIVVYETNGDIVSRIG
jgi:hypothetical protein